MQAVGRMPTFEQASVHEGATGHQLLLLQEYGYTSISCRKRKQGVGARRVRGDPSEPGRASRGSRNARLEIGGPLYGLRSLLLGVRELPMASLVGTQLGSAPVS